MIKPAPTVTFSGLPATKTGGSATPSTFTVKVTNPSGGLSYTHLFFNLKLSGIRNLTHTTVSVQYKDSSTAWCTLVRFRGTTTNINGNVASVGTSCTPTYPASFSLAAGASTTIHLRVAYPASGYYGVQTLTGTVSTGTCATSSGTVSCTAVSPLSGTAAAVGTGSLVVIPSSPLATSTSDTATRPATSTVRKTFNVALESRVTPTTTGFGLPAPTGTVSYTVNGTHFTNANFISLVDDQSTTGLTLYNTATLSIGKHTVVSTYTPTTYSGHKIYSSSTLTETFTVIAAPTGTRFSCIITGEGVATIPAYVTASGTVPSSAYDGTRASVTGVSVSLDADPAVNAVFYNTAQTAATLGFSPDGTNASKGPITFTGTTRTMTDVKGTWTGMSTSVLVTGTVGSKVTVGANLVVFRAGFSAWDCTPVTSAAPIGTITVASPPTPVTWSLSGCTSGSTTAPSWANTEKIVAKGGGGGGGGAAASATGYGGAGGAGGSVTTTLTIAGSTKVSAKTGCAGKGAPQGGGVVGNGGASVSGWSSSGKGGQGRYTAIGITHGNDGTGGSGGGSTGVCNGASTCTSATTAHVVTVASGGGGGGESMCSGTDAGSGGQAGNAGTTATSSSKGKGLSGTGGATGGTGGVAGGAGGANNKSSGSGSATGSTGGEGKEPVAGDGGGSGGGGAGYIGGAGGAPTADDCGAGGGGGGGASWVATAGGSTTFGTGASGGSRSGTTGSAGSVTVTFSYTKTR